MWQISRQIELSTCTSKMHCCKFLTRHKWLRKKKCLCILSILRWLPWCTSSISFRIVISAYTFYVDTKEPVLQSTRYAASCHLRNEANNTPTTVVDRLGCFWWVSQRRARLFPFCDSAPLDQMCLVLNEASREKSKIHPDDENMIDLSLLQSKEHCDPNRCSSSSYPAIIIIPSNHHHHTQQSSSYPAIIIIIPSRARIWNCSVVSSPMMSFMRRM